MPFRLGSSERRAFSDSSTKVVTVAHQQQGRHGSECVNQSEDPALALGQRERESRKQFVLERRARAKGAALDAGKLQPAGAAMDPTEHLTFRTTASREIITVIQALIILAVSAQITIRRRAADSTAGERRWKF